MMGFFEYYLRTIDVDGARAFYSAVLGDRKLEVFQLHEQALARGARPHWLGFIDVGDVDGATSAFVARGATSLGPKWVNPQGLEASVVRDPGGAVVALAKPAPKPASDASAGDSSLGVEWHLLNTRDVEGAKKNYSEVLGWEFKAPLDLGTYGVFHPFAWQAGGAPVGSMSDIATRPGVHPHWLFHFRVGALDPAVDAVRARGGSVVESVVIPGGDRIAICDDPQGAAFTLREDSAAAGR
ncbi:MAG TPA: VOC family protein [Polyangiaceae bacterium]|jgi:hypothetical protein|nr:VOC family protein [Polyangiaceae bacterium]